MRAILKSRQQIASGTIQIDLELPEEVDLIAGQSFRLTIPSPSPLRGEEKGGGEFSKFFSIVNPSGLTKIFSTAMRVRDTAFKKFISTTPLGTEMDVSSIAGVFLMPDDPNISLILIAGGIGITPFVSMLRTERLEKRGRKITLLYSNPDNASLAFKDELQDIAEFFIGRRIDQNILKKYILLDNQFYISGPPAMTGDMYNQLISLGIDSQNIKTEEFTGY